MMTKSKCKYLNRHLEAVLEIFCREYSGIWVLSQKLWVHVMYSFFCNLPQVAKTRFSFFSKIARNAPLTSKIEIQT